MADRTQPRWTVDDDGDLRYETNRYGATYVMRAWVDDDGFDALVRAVEDANRLPAIEAERDRFREHSILLNSVVWRLASALGDVSAAVEAIEADVEDIVSRVVARLTEVTDG